MIAAAFPACPAADVLANDTAIQAACARVIRAALSACFPGHDGRFSKWRSRKRVHKFDAWRREPQFRNTTARNEYARRGLSERAAGAAKRRNERALTQIVRRRIRTDAARSLGYKPAGVGEVFAGFCVRACGNVRPRRLVRPGKHERPFRLVPLLRAKTTGLFDCSSDADHAEAAILANTSFEQ